MTCVGCRLWRYLESPNPDLVGLSALPSLLVLQQLFLQCYCVAQEEIHERHSITTLMSKMESGKSARSAG